MTALIAAAACASCGHGAPPGHGPGHRASTARPAAGHGAPGAGDQSSRPPTGLRTIAVAASPDPVAYSHGSIWVGHYGPDIVERINPATGRVIARVRVGGSPIWIEGDPRWIWVANYDSSTVSRIDPRTNRVTATVPVGAEPEGLAIAAGIVWTSNHGDGTLSRIDERTGRRRASLHIGGQPVYISAHGTTLWVTNSDEAAGPLHKLQKIDARTGRIVHTVSVGHQPVHAIEAYGAVWITDYHDGAVYRLNPRTLRQTARIPVRGAPDPLYPYAHRLWVGDDAGLTITPINPQTNQAGPAITLPSTTRNMASTPGSLWIAGFADSVVYQVPVR